MSEGETSHASGAARLRQFPKPFWVINAIELFERGAYYTLNAVFLIFATAVLTASGMDAVAATALAGTLTAVLFLLLYIVPVFGAPFTEKYGYRASLAVVFVLLAGGYVASFFATGVWLLFLAAGLIGVGAGIFKPIPAAVVTQTSDTKQRNFAFAIYYACINIGAFVFPLGVGMAHLLIIRGGGNPFQDVQLTGAEQQLLFQISFGTAAVLSALNLVLSVTVFRNLREPQRDKNVLQSVATLKEVFRYPSFLVLMVIYAGFWFMYAMGISLIAKYMGDFTRMPAWFTASLLMSINPLVIIVAAPLLGPITERFNSLPLMIVGILVYAGGLLMVGWSSTALVFVGGVIVFSLGELLTHPSYLSYVSKIAPPGKESVFLGYGFLPIGVGLFIGSSLGVTVYAVLAIGEGRPEMFWSIVGAVGIVTSAALIIYNAVLSRLREPKEERARRGFPIGTTAAALAVLLLAPAVLGAGTVMPGSGGGSDVEPLASANLVSLALPDVEDATDEGKSTAVVLALPANATGEATVVLTWTDEPASGTGATNAPDSFMLHVKAPNGTIVAESEAVANPQGGEGRIELTFPALPGDYTVEVMNAESGDVTTRVGPLALPGNVGGSADTGNAWKLAATTQAASA